MTLNVDILVLTTTRWKLICTTCLVFVAKLATSDAENAILGTKTAPDFRYGINNASYFANNASDYEFVDYLLSELYDADNSSVPLDNFSFRKCLCGVQEVRSSGKCVSVNTSVILPFLKDLYPETSISVDLLKSPVIISNVSCRGSDIAVELKNALYILGNGELYSGHTDLFFPTDKYCFEFISERNIVNAIARVCVPLPKVPVCDYRAHSIETDHLSILVASQFVSSPHLDADRVETLQCGKEEQIRFISGEEDISFHLISGDFQALWNPSGPIRVPQVFSRDKYCLVPSQGGSLDMRACYDDPVVRHEKRCNASVCVRKCCPDHHAYDAAAKKCVFERETKSENLFSFYDLESRSFVPAPQPVLIDYSFPWCEPEQLYIIDPATNPADQFFLLTNGSLYISLSELAMPSSLYCVDDFVRPNDGGRTRKAISCFLEQKNGSESCRNVHRILYPILIVISCAFLAVTLLVYSVIPELHSKLHGKSLLSHVSSLLFAFLCQLVVSWSSKSLSMTGCKIMALGNQVSFLWAFFWLNVMCFDIWWTLKSMSLIPETGESSRRRFALYSAYAWGCPVVIAFFTAVMEFLPSSVDKSALILPGFGLRGCWFQDVRSTWVYFHGFTLSLYVLNIFFFFHVAAILINQQRSTEAILRTTRKQHKERVYLYLKLFVVMGITWICEVASWQEGTCEYWIFTDIINSLQGVMIFFIFMCNKKVYQKIQARGAPLFRRMKALVRSPSSFGSVDARQNSSSQRTTQTSDESSSRRLSSSVSPPEIQLIIKKPETGIATARC